MVTHSTSTSYPLPIRPDRSPHSINKSSKMLQHWNAIFYDERQFTCIVFPERIEHSFRHFYPSEHASELDEVEEGDVDVGSVEGGHRRVLNGSVAEHELGQVVFT